MKEYIFKISDGLFNEETGEVCIKPELSGELIRCKDCKHYIHKFKECDLSLWDITCNDYCSKAERK